MRNIFFIFCLVLFISGMSVAGYLFLFEKEQPLGEVPSEWGEKTAFWKQKIEERGAAEVYAALGGHVDSLSYSQRHVEAHAFGAALYEVEGVAGISVCDDQYAFGCFHQFLGDAIAALGLGSIRDLNAACFKALEKNGLACQHGIGHGILGALGYDEESLDTALDTCRGLPGIDPIGGCYSGVFMEYNVRTMLADAAEPREFLGNLFAPCDALDATFVPACIYSQPQWWQRALFNGSAGEKEFGRMGEYCRTFARTAELERQCFGGIGNIVAIASDFDAARARMFCEAVGSPRQQLLCLSIGANHFGIDVDAESAMRVCEGLTGQAADYCHAYARNELNIVKIGTLPL